MNEKVYLIQRIATKYNTKKVTFIVMIHMLTPSSWPNKSEWLKKKTMI